MNISSVVHMIIGTNFYTLLGDPVQYSTIDLDQIGFDLFFLKISRNYIKNIVLDNLFK